MNLESRLIHLESLPGSTPHYFCAHYSQYPFRALTCSKLPKIIDVMQSIEQRWHTPYIRFNVISIHGFSWRWLTILWNVSLQSSINRTTSAGVTFFRRQQLTNIKKPSQYSTTISCPDDLVNKYLKPNMPMSSQRFLHGYTRSSKAHKEQNVHIHCIETLWPFSDHCENGSSLPIASSHCSLKPLHRKSVMWARKQCVRHNCVRQARRHFSV